MQHLKKKVSRCEEARKIVEQIVRSKKDSEDKPAKWMWLRSHALQWNNIDNDHADEQDYEEHR